MKEMSFKFGVKGGGIDRWRECNRYSMAQALMFYKTRRRSRTREVELLCTDRDLNCKF